MTQSTISQQLARLEDGSATSLVDRDARPLSARPAGDACSATPGGSSRFSARGGARWATPPAPRRSGSGCPRTSSAGPMAGLFRDFAAGTGRHPARRYRRLSRELIRRFRAGQLDIAVVKEAGHPAPMPRQLPRADGLGRGRGRRDWPDPMPLVVFPAGGLYREDVRSGSSASGGAGTSPSLWHQPRRRSGGGRGRPRHHPAAGRHHRRRSAPSALGDDRRSPPPSTPGSGPGRSRH